MLSNKYKRFISTNLFKRRFCSSPPKSFDVENEIKDINKKLDSMRLPTRYYKSNNFFWFFVAIGVLGYWTYCEYNSTKLKMEIAKHNRASEIEKNNLRIRGVKC